MPNNKTLEHWWLKATFIALFCIFFNRIKVQSFICWSKFTKCSLIFSSIKKSIFWWYLSIIQWFSFDVTTRSHLMEYIYNKKIFSYMKKLLKYIIANIQIRFIKAWGHYKENNMNYRNNILSVWRAAPKSWSEYTTSDKGWKVN